MEISPDNIKIQNSRFFSRRPLCIVILSFCLLILGFSGTVGAQLSVEGSLKYPWVGGLNSCIFGEIDLDLNGHKDLVIFERFGNRLFPFIQNGTSGSVDYSYHPKYVSLFPALSEWVRFIDYDCDGRSDIFTYNAGGIRVYRNVSDSVLTFRLVTDLLKSFYYSGYTGILGTPVDFPAFSDMDKDGDMDILTFFGLGSFVEFHRNFSMENFGHCDSLDFHLADNCWGHFMESEGGNKITLNAPCPSGDFFPSLQGMTSGMEKHTGSTMLAADMNGDGLQDLLLGDVDFPNLILLLNGGTKDTAHMVSVDSAFPGPNRPVKLFSFPSCSMLDVNNDGLRDLLISPFDPSFLISENHRSVWYYENIGTENIPVFQFREDRFFQNQMIDVGTNAHPVLFDIDEDGLLDLFIGNYGYYDSSYYKSGVLHSVYTSRVAYYRNEGSSQMPLFKFITDDFGDLSAFHLTGIYPAFGDLDQDQDFDLVLGNTDGTLIFLENDAGSGHTPVFKNPVFNFQNVDVENSSTPQLFDLDRDGLIDLVVGKREGTLSYYRNTGTVNQPQFSLITEKLGEINITNPNLSYYGYSVPCFFRDKNNQIALLVGSDEGVVHHFRCIENNLNGTFCASDSLCYLISRTPFEIRSGIRVSPAIGFLNDPLMMDLVVGNFAGGLCHFSSQPSPIVMPGVFGEDRKLRNAWRIFPNPADKSVRIQLDRKREINSAYRLEVFNSMGIRITTTILSISGETEFSTSGFPEGLFFLVLSEQGSLNSDNRYTRKIIIRH